ncbi:unnamed protein product [Ectocarpus sp. CCAP 1310/34]|nr:unnamed protein product [Ectocarpus sp. CCAP 1310/34]
MAGAISSAENGGSLSGSRSSQPPPLQQQQQQQQHRRRAIHGAPGLRQAPAGRPLRPRLSSLSRASSSSSSTARAASRASSPFGGGSGSGGGFLPSNAARVGGRGSHSSISTRTNSSSSSSSGLWASIVSLGASAFPASLSGIAAVEGVPPPSTPTPWRVARRNAASSSSAIVARAAAAAAGQPPPPGGVGTRLRNASSLSVPSSSALLPAAVSGVGDRSRVAVASRAVEGVRVLPPPPPPVAPSVEVAAGDRQEGAAAGAAAAVVPISGSVAGKASSANKLVYLEGGHSVYTCSMCRAHLATRDHLVSECFQGHGGRAFLFERCVNVSIGRPEDRRLLTGMHVVADISCKACGAELGWKYEEAADKSQKYKEGKFILERCAVTLESRSGDGYYGLSSSGRFGGAEQRCGSSSIIGWGADNAPFAGGGSRW